jgi:anti-sigma factor RsiW
MKNQIKSRDWEALSAYLDGQLSNREHTRLETRLRSEPELQVALEELQQTRGVLRSLPKLRVPRNFTLTPEMVGLKRDTPRMIPVLSFASVLAMILLVFVVIGDFMQLHLD